MPKRPRSFSTGRRPAKRYKRTYSFRRKRYVSYPKSTFRARRPWASVGMAKGRPFGTIKGPVKEETWWDRAVNTRDNLVKRYAKPADWLVRNVGPAVATFGVPELSAVTWLGKLARYIGGGGARRTWNFGKGLYGMAKSLRTTAKQARSWNKMRGYNWLEKGVGTGIRKPGDRLPPMPASFMRNPRQSLNWELNQIRGGKDIYGLPKASKFPKSRPAIKRSPSLSPEKWKNYKPNQRFPEGRVVQYSISGGQKAARLARRQLQDPNRLLPNKGKNPVSRHS